MHVFISEQNKRLVYLVGMSDSLCRSLLSFVNYIYNICACYCIVCVSAWEDNPQASFSKWFIACTDVKPYNNLLVAFCSMHLIVDVKY